MCVCVRECVCDGIGKKRGELIERNLQVGGERESGEREKSLKSNIYVTNANTFQPSITQVVKLIGLLFLLNYKETVEKVERKKKKN